MTKNRLTDFSWVDNAIKELKSDPPSVLDEVSNTIMKFNSMKPEEISDEYIHSVIDRLTYFFFMFPYNVKKPMDVWRVRRSKCGDLFDHTDDLKYPPTNCAEIGRANFPFSSIFYAGSSPETVIAECRLKEGDFFHLTKYSLQPDPIFNLHILGDIDNLRRRSKTVFEVLIVEKA